MRLGYTVWPANHSHSVLWYYGPGHIETLHLSSSYCMHKIMYIVAKVNKIGRVLHVHTRVLNHEFSTSNCNTVASFDLGQVTSITRRDMLRY